jgi:LPS-assembly protein
VRVDTAESRVQTRLARLYGATALACLFAIVPIGTPAVAQDVDEYAAGIPSDSQMLLEADSLVYDQDSNTVTAIGGVQIEYAGNRLVADSVSYNRRTQRLTATGKVQIIEKDGNKIYADEIDVTDDFRDGFVNSLQIETVDKTYFGAESADRKDGNITTFNNGVYTACAPCEEKPDRAPIWRIKSRKIIWNGQEKVVRFERASFELFGMPIASLPFFEMADPTVKRKSGFLFPSIFSQSDLGVGVGIPYYFALSPTFDLTVTARGYTKQGFLGEAEWRQQFNNGGYTLKVAGISQSDPEQFGRNTVDRGPDGDLNKVRAMVGSKGEFRINPRWTFGWDILYQTDKNFSRTYQIGGFEQAVHRSEIYLTGLNERNYFDMRFMRFEVQEELRDEFLNRYGDKIARNDKQPWVLPSFDYSLTPDEPIFGGELNIDINARILRRDEIDRSFDSGQDPFNFTDDRIYAVRGVEGTNGRATAEAEWKRTFVTDAGLVITPLLHVQGDGTFVDQSQLSIDSINAMAANPRIDVASDIRSEYFRYMATAGLEVRWPILFSSSSATHVLEPMGQIFARPDERYAETLGIPNEDAQSMAFDATSLFDRDKFSGYDRIEGGTRANLGLRYTGTFSNGWTGHGLFGQSYHLAGLNSYATPDLVNVGAYSGLESDRSDYVGLVGLATPRGFNGSVGGRFDEETFEMRRLETKVGYATRPFSVQAKYAFIQAQPLYGFDRDREEVSLGASKRLHENWRVFGSGTYDIQQDLLTQNAFGFGYDDECFSIALTYAESRKFIGSTREIDRTQSVGFQLSFRTLGDFGTSTGAFGTQ